MTSALTTSFGSDSFFRELKHAWQTDANTAGQLLLDQTKMICRSIINSVRNGFYNVTKEDYDDYVQESWIKLWQNMDSFLSDPRNDPDSEGEHFSAAQKYQWARFLILHEMQHMRDRKLGRNIVSANGERIRIIPLDYLGSSNDESFSLLDILSAQAVTPEEAFVVSSSVQEALQQLFNLPNNTETLIAVGYTILASSLEEKKAMEEYADYLNGHTFGEIIASMELLLNEHGYQSSPLTSLRTRIEREKIAGQKPTISSKKLINRKNDILTTMRRILEQLRSDEKKGELK